MSKIGLFYGPQGGNVDKIAKRIANSISTKEVDLHLVKEVNAEKLTEYSNIILGISTLGKHNWSSSNAGNDWDKFLPNLNRLDLKGKKIALFGLGDHIAYADFFVDAMGDLYEMLQTTGAEIIGKVSAEGYTFKDSKAFVDEQFVGLPLDEDFEANLTEERLKNWLKQILAEFES